VDRATAGEPRRIPAKRVSCRHEGTTGSVMCHIFATTRSLRARI
jgi:hypothetical protein